MQLGSSVKAAQREGQQADTTVSCEWNRAKEGQEQRDKVIYSIAN